MHERDRDNATKELTIAYGIVKSIQEGYTGHHSLISQLHTIEGCLLKALIFLRSMKCEQIIKDLTKEE